MLRYQPPKSNSWGHSLRKMLPSKQRRLFNAFQDLAIAKIGRRYVSFSVERVSFGDPEPSVAIAEFETLFGRMSRNGSFELDEGQRDMAIDALEKKEADFLDLPYTLTLSDCMRIEAWRMQGSECETESSMFWYFGQQPRISTSLRFNTRDEFYFVQEVLLDLGVCRLNEKHLKEMKRGLKKP